MIVCLEHPEMGELNPVALGALSFSRLADEGMVRVPIIFIIMVYLNFLGNRCQRYLFQVVAKMSDKLNGARGLIAKWTPLL
jgi:hypothetical protein